MYETVIDVETAVKQLDNPHWVWVDCRFKLVDTAFGGRVYQESHIPGAIYAHLDDDLSGPPVTDNGRHPLPTPEVLLATFGRMGIDGQKQVVVYDDMNGGIAARLWWMLRYMGHSAVAVLDGGWQAWLEADGPTRSGQEQNAPTTFVGAPRPEWLVVLSQVASLPLLVDSRDPVRYRGELETIDPRAGHIPGAKNYFFQQNWTTNGRFLPAAQIRQQMEQLLGETPAAQTTFYCGSGVTACANLLAMTYAGLGNGRLYVGSWSEWSRDPQRPMETNSHES